MHYDIFISYRRATGKNFARIIKPELEKRGFSVFLDFDELKDGVFDKRIMDAIKDSPIFLLILSEGALDRCANDDDWVKEEILCAKKHEKHIVPVNVDNSFSGIPEELPEDVKAALGAHHYSKIDTESLLEESMEKLIRERISPHLIEAEKKRKAEAVALRKRERQESIRNMYMRINSWLRGHYKMILLSIVVLLGICMIVIFWSRATSPSSNLDLKNDSTSVGNQEVVNVITDKIVNDSLVVVSNAPEGRGHYKYFNVDEIPSETTVQQGILSFTFNINAERNPGEAEYPINVNLLTDSLLWEREKISETRYKCKVHDLKDGINNIVVQITEVGCPPASFPFEITYTKPSEKTKNKPAVEEKVVIKKKTKKETAPIPHLDI